MPDDGEKESASFWSDSTSLAHFLVHLRHDEKTKTELVYDSGTAAAAAAACSALFWCLD
jgi:hypothetical protein